MKVAAAVAVIGAVFAEWSGVGRRPRPRAADRQRPARDRARVRRHAPALRARHRALRRLRAARAARRRLDAPTDPEDHDPPRRSPAARRCAARCSPAAARRPSRRGAAGAGAREPFTLCSTTSRTPTTPASTPRRRAASTSSAGLDVKIQRRRTPPAPLSCCRPGAPTSRSPTSPSCCWRATRARDLVAVGALVQKPLTSLMSLGEAGDPTPEDLARQARRHRRASPTSRPT